jgi:hypothetical protein
MKKLCILPYSPDSVQIATFPVPSACVATGVCSSGRSWALQTLMTGRGKDLRHASSPSLVVSCWFRLEGEGFRIAGSLVLATFVCAPPLLFLLSFCQFWGVLSMNIISSFNVVGSSL